MDYALNSPTSTPTVGLDQAVASLPSIHSLRSRTQKRAVAHSRAAFTTTTGFAALANTWERETRNVSCLDEKVSHWAYRQIVNMGPSVIPEIIDRMQIFGGFWFPALEELAEWNPIPEEHYGDMKKMREAWVRWEKSPNAAPYRRPRYLLPAVSETA